MADTTIKGFRTQGGIEKYDFASLANIPPDEVEIGDVQPADKSKLWVDTADDPEAADLVKKSELVDLVYPIGSVYISLADTNPANFIGGTWERIKDRFVLAAGDTYAAGDTGGEASHTLTTDEMAAHTHAVGSAGLMRVAQSSSSPYWAWYNAAGYNQLTALSSGGNAAHNNMPPYLVVFMWQRTA